jgi:hypothetical protein
MILLSFPYHASPSAYNKPWSKWSAAHTCSYKFDIIAEERGIRCKQFLYDMAPLSSFDHGGLYDYFPWKIKVRSHGGQIYWTGYDYGGFPALFFYKDGTNVELRVFQGEFNENELLDLASSMLSDKMDFLNKFYFSHMTYWSRYQRYEKNLYLNDYKLPSSMWKLRGPWHDSEHL